MSKNPISNKPRFTPEATIGPFFPFPFDETVPRSAALLSPGVIHRPDGQPIAVAGKVLDSAGVGIRNMIVESWQANAHGRYRHPLDWDGGDLDPAFDGFARIRTDAEGSFRLETIKPGARPCVGVPAMRAPHLRLTIFGSGIDRLVTFAYFEDEPLNDEDPLLASLDTGLRPRLLARRCLADDAGGVASYRFDIVLRGEAETPFFDDWS